MGIELSCECGNESEFTETTETVFGCDAEGNREDKIRETTLYRCNNCGKFAEVCNTDESCERNGFFNTPAECENSECADCELDLEQRMQIDCPYLVT